jgi:hypothetical protein
VVDHRSARAIALGVRIDRGERVLDLLCSTVLLVGVSMFNCAPSLLDPFLFGAGAGVDVCQIHRPRAGKARDVEHGLRGVVTGRHGGEQHRQRHARRKDGRDGEQQ